MAMDELLEKVLGRITPTGEERKAEKELVERVLALLSRYPVEPLVVGSIAKDTDLAGEKDVDVFIAFPENTSRDELEKKGLEIGNAVMKALKVEAEVDYAEHPYVKGSLGKHLLEIVPCYQGQQIKSAVDRTPHHTRYVNEKLDANLKGLKA